jgi:hypothetical protein
MTKPIKVDEFIATLEPLSRRKGDTPGRTAASSNRRNRG